MRFFFNPQTTFSLSLIDFLKKSQYQPEYNGHKVKFTLVSGKYFTHWTCELSQETLLSWKYPYNYWLCRTTVNWGLRGIWKRRFRPESASNVSVHTASEEFKKATFTSRFGFVFRENSVKVFTWVLRPHRFRTAPFQRNVFRQHENEQQAFSNSSSLKSVFQKRRFCIRLVWKVGLSCVFKFFPA